jgi:hypothetical protein
VDWLRMVAVRDDERSKLRIIDDREGGFEASVVGRELGDRA